MSLHTNLISYWKMDESSGNALDSHGPNTLLDNNTVGSAVGKLGNARDFEKDNTEWFSCTSGSLQTGDVDYSFACWLRFESISASATIFTKSNGTTPGTEYLLFRTAGDTLKFLVYGASSVFVESTALAAGVWYHVVIWQDSINNEIGISINNGTPVTASIAAITPNTTSYPFYVGTWVNVWYYDGLIDELGFWKRVLTSQERTQLYNAGNGLAYPLGVTLPSKTNLLTLDFSYLGEPFCFVEAKSGQNTNSLDFSYLGEPFVGAVEVVTNHSLTANAVAASAPGLATPTIAQAQALTPTGVASGAATLGTPTIAQNQALTPNGLSAGAATLGTPTIAQNQALTPNGLSAGAATLGIPTIELTTGLVPTGVNSGAPALGAPAIAQDQVILPASVVSAQTSLGAPTIAQDQVILPSGVATGQPSCGTPAISPVHNLTVNDLSVSAPALASPTVAQDHAATPTSITSETPMCGAPTLAQHQAVIPLGLAGGAASLATPAIAQSHALAPTFTVAGSPSCGAPAIGQSHSLTPTVLSSGAPSVPMPTLTQVHIFTAVGIGLGTPTVATTTITQDSPGPLWSSLLAARNMLRDCYWWRTVLSTESPWDDVTAESHIHVDELPAPIAGVNHTRAELTSLRPFAIVWTDLTGGLQMRSDTGGNCCAIINGTVVCRIELPVPADIATDPLAVGRWVNQRIGKIVKSDNPGQPGLWELSGQPGYLPLTQLQVSGYVRTDRKEKIELGDAVTCELQLSWGAE